MTCPQCRNLVAIITAGVIAVPLCLGVLGCPSDKGSTPGQEKTRPVSPTGTPSPATPPPTELKPPAQVVAKDAGVGPAAGSLCEELLRAAKALSIEPETWLSKVREAEYLLVARRQCGAAWSAQDEASRRRAEADLDRLEVSQKGLLPLAVGCEWQYREVGMGGLKVTARKVVESRPAGSGTLFLTTKTDYVSQGYLVEGDSVFLQTNEDRCLWFAFPASQGRSYRIRCGTDVTVTWQRAPDVRTPFGKLSRCWMVAALQEHVVKTLCPGVGLVQEISDSGRKDLQGGKFPAQEFVSDALLERAAKTKPQANKPQSPTVTMPTKTAGAPDASPVVGPGSGDPLSQVETTEADAAAWDLLKQAEQTRASARDLARAANSRGYRLLTVEKLPERALPFFEYALKKDRTYGMPRYNAAKCYALRGDVDNSVKNLLELKRMGRGQRERLDYARKDDGFSKVREDSRFKAIFE